MILVRKHRNRLEAQNFLTLDNYTHDSGYFLCMSFHTNCEYNVCDLSAFSESIEEVNALKKAELNGKKPFFLELKEV